MATAGNLPDLSAGGSIFLVAKQSNTSTDNSGVFIGAGTQVNMQIQRGNVTGGGLTSIRGGIDTAAWAQSSAIVPEDTFVSIRLKYDGTNIYLSINDAIESSAVADGAGYSATPLTLFKSLGGSQGNKQIAEILIYTRYTDTDEDADLEERFLTKYAHY